MIRCPKCGKILFPQICPSVIIGIRKGDSLLLTTYSPRHVMMGNGTTHRAPGVGYALVAGYIETGESPEQAAAREALEEVGLHVGNFRYFASQPWPFNGSLLLGYFCDALTDEDITLEKEELSRAVWVPRKEIPAANPFSLTGTMINAFRDGLDP